MQMLCVRTLQLRTPTLGLCTLTWELCAHSTKLRPPTSWLRALAKKLCVRTQELHDLTLELRALPQELRAPTMGLHAPTKGLRTPTMGLRALTMKLRAPTMGLRARIDELVINMSLCELIMISWTTAIPQMNMTTFHHRLHHSRLPMHLLCLEVRMRPLHMNYQQDNTSMAAHITISPNHRPMSQTLANGPVMTMKLGGRRATLRTRGTLRGSMYVLLHPIFIFDLTFLSLCRGLGRRIRGPPWIISML